MLNMLALAGLALVVAGCWQLHPALGLIVAGVLLFVSVEAHQYHRKWLHVLSGRIGKKSAIDTGRDAE